MQIKMSLLDFLEILSALQMKRDLPEMPPRIQQEWQDEINRVYIHNLKRYIQYKKGAQIHAENQTQS